MRASAGAGIIIPILGMAQLEFNYTLYHQVMSGDVINAFRMQLFS